ALLTLASLLSLLNLSTEQNLTRLFPQDLRAVRACNDILENFDVESNLFLLMGGDSTQQLIDASTEYVDRLRKKRDLVAEAHNRLTDDQRVFYFEVLPRYLFLALPGEGLGNTLEFLGDAGAVRGQMDANLRLLQTAAPGIKERIERDPLNLAERADLLARLAEAGGKVAITEEGYYLSEDGRAVLVHVRGVRPAHDIPFARKLVRAAREAAPEGFRVRIGGGYAVAVQDEGIIRGDMIQSTVMSVVLIFLLFWIVFRSFGAMLQGTAPLIVSLLCAIGAIALLFGRLNPLLAGSAAIIAGVGIDFSIHVMTRFRHELAAGTGPEDAIAVSVARVGRGLALAAATTVAVFLSFLTSDLRGMAEFGLITALGIFLCLVATHTLLPALLRLWRARPASVLGGIRPITRGRGVALALSAVLFLAALWIGFGPGQGGFSFEPDWKNLRPKNDPALETQEEIGRLFWGSAESISLLVRGEPAAKLGRLEPALEGLRSRGVIASYRSSSSILPPADRQQHNRELLARLDVDRTLQSIRDAMDAAGFRVEAYGDYLKGLESGLRRERLLDASVLHEEGLESLLAPHVAGEFGMAQLFLGEEIWERETRKRILDEVHRSLEETGVEYSLTGFKIVSGEMESLLKKDFTRLLLVSGGVILLITLVAFRDPRLVLLCLVPLAGGLALLAAFMKLAGLHVNVMNLVAFPMVVGLGIDDGVHLAHLYRDARPDEFDKLLPVTLRAILLTTVTTLLAFGSLALTQNRGIASLGLVTGAGMVCCLIPSFFTLPAALHFMNRRRRPNS
ncbi:MAG: efflux RND transporter permease subunit, partial [Planctomycetota bacterium]